MTTYSTETTKTTAKKAGKKIKAKTKAKVKAPKKSAPAKVAKPKIEPVDNAIVEIIDQLLKDKEALLPQNDIGVVISQVCEKYSDVTKKQIANPEQVLEKLKLLASSFGKQIDFQENSIGEMVVKYRIKQGRLFHIMKKVVRASKEKWGAGRWTPLFGQPDGWAKL